MAQSVQETLSVLVPHDFITPFAVLVVVVVAWALSTLFSKRDTPPGPWKLPVLGNLWAFPSDQPWKALKVMSRTYGDVIYFEGLGLKLLSLNTWDAARDLLDARAANTGDRAHSEVLSIVQEHGALPYGMRNLSQTSTLLRKIFTTTLKRLTAPEYSDRIELEARAYVNHVLEHPDALLTQLKTEAARLLLSLAYGFEIDNVEDKLVIQTDEIMMTLIDYGLKPLSFAVDFFPLLRYMPRWIPGAESVYEARQVGRRLDGIIKAPWEMVKKSVEDGSAKPSMIKMLIEDNKADEALLQEVSSTLYAGGVDNMVATMTIFWRAMLANPAAQKRAQDDLDAVVGTDRLPTLKDRRHLPYIDAIIKELMRWWVIAPLSFPHAVRKEDVFRGWRIPAGTTVFPNSWAISRDPVMYPNPEEFIPERFLVDPPPLDPKRYVGGYGQRSCSGMDFASAFFFITIAMALHSFTIKRPLDPDGQEVLPDLRVLDASLNHPKWQPFTWELEPRSSHRASLLAMTLADSVPS